MNKIIIIGIGGIGQWVLEPLCLFLQQQSETPTVCLVDGDSYEERNRGRQLFSRLGKKAQVKVDELARRFPRLNLLAIPCFVTIENIGEIISDGDWVVLAVDNHATRKIVSNFCQSLSDAVLVSGGNELTDGDVSIYVRSGGRDVTLPLTAFHKEIQFPADEDPSGEGCGDLVEVEPQLIFTNFLIATGILTAFYRVWLAFTLVKLGVGWQEAFAEVPDEVYYDLPAFLSRPVKRREE